MCPGLIKEIQTTPAADLHEVAHAKFVSSIFCQLCHSELLVDYICFVPFQNKTDKGELPFEEAAPCV